MTGAIKTIWGYTKPWIPSPIQRMGSRACEAAKGLCTTDTLIGVAEACLQHMECIDYAIFNMGGA